MVKKNNAMVRNMTRKKSHIMMKIKKKCVSMMNRIKTNTKRKKRLSMKENNNNTWQQMRTNTWLRRFQLKSSRMKKRRAMMTLISTNKTLMSVWISSAKELDIEIRN